MRGRTGALCPWGNGWPPTLRSKRLWAVGLPRTDPGPTSLRGLSDPLSTEPGPARLVSRASPASIFVRATSDLTYLEGERQRSEGN